MAEKPTYEELEHRVLELEKAELHRNAIETVAFPELENHSAIILLIDPDSGAIINANIAAQNYYGYSIKTLKQMRIQEINMLSPDEVAEKRYQAISEKCNYFEFSHRLASGEIRAVEVHSSPVVSNHKKLLLSTIHDITDRKRTEEKLKVSEEKYRNLIVTTTEGFWLLDSNQKTIDVNQSLCDMLGYSRNEMIGKMPFGFFDEENLKILKEQTSRIASTLHRTYEINIRKKDGTNLPTISNATSLFDKNGKPDGSFALVTDITERKLVEEELRLNRILLRNVLDIVPAFICAKNLDGEFILVNKKLTDFYGTTVEAMTNVNHSDLCEDENELRAMLAADREVIESAKPIFIPEETMEKPDGSIIILETFKIPFTAMGEPAVLIASNDITDRKQAEKEHEKLQNRLQQAKKMESVGRLAGGIAHDFNNILQVIMGHAQVLEQSCSDERDALSVKGVLDSARRAADLTKQLLLFSRRQVMSLQVLDFNELVENTLSMIRRIIGEQIKLEWLPGASDCFINADRSMIEQVVMNLCVNARDAMPSGGLLKIETTNELVDSGLCSSHSWVSPGRFVLLSVTDTGEGMDKATMERIFEPFYTTKEMGKGTGIGLATVYGIVKQHKGMILAHSEPGNGSLFKIYLPLSELEVVEVETIADSYAGGGSETILLAEDDDMVRDLAKELLERAGYSVLVASDGHEAVSVFRSSDSIDLLLFDVIMPNLGGHGAMTEIRKLQPEIPVLFSSGYSKDTIHTDFVLHEGVMLIQKPYSLDQLLLAVRRALDS